MNDNIQKLAASAADRFSFWENFIQAFSIEQIAEIGVYKGDFAAHMLKVCPSIESYTMIDPWRNLADWNKPANEDSTTFDTFYNTVLERTNFAAEKRKILRGTTSEVADSIQAESLDFIYIDGDHTLRGITIDLLQLWDKVAANGWIGGDDLSETIWQHDSSFEPTFVFPFAVYFAEAKNVTIYCLPHSQFLIDKSSTAFACIDLTGGRYARTDVQYQFELLRQSQGFKQKLATTFPSVFKFYKSLFT